MQSIILYLSISVLHFKKNNFDYPNCKKTKSLDSLNQELDCRVYKSFIKRYLATHTLIFIFIFKSILFFFQS